MRKIFIYIDTMYRGGAQRVMANLSGHFAVNGYEVIMCNDFKQNDDMLCYSVNENVKRVYLENEESGNFVKKNINRILNLRHLINLEKPDIVLSFLGGPNKRMLLATIGLRVKKVVSVRNDPNKEYGASVLSRWFARRLFTLADGCVFQTEDAAAYFPLSVRRRSKIIMNPVDKRFFEVQRAEDPKDIVSVGRLMEQKNHKLLIRAFSKIAGEFPEENLIIYGDGPMRSELEKLCEELNLKERISLPGATENVEEVLSKAKCFVMSSDYEGMPNALMEAMAAGVPCISTDCPCGGPKMLIQNEKQGILTNCNDIEMLAEKIKMILSDDVFRETLGHGAHSRMQDCKSSVVLGEWENYLNNL